MATQPLAEAFPVGDFLAEELEERGWSEADFTAIMGRPTRFVEELISGERELTRESAELVGAALGTSAELWLNLQDTYRAWDNFSRRYVWQLPLGLNRYCQGSSMPRRGANATTPMPTTASAASTPSTTAAVLVSVVVYCARVGRCALTCASSASASAT